MKDEFMCLWMMDPTHNFVNYTLMKKLFLPRDPSTHSYVVSLMNGSDKDVWDKKCEMFH